MSKYKFKAKPFKIDRNKKDNEHNKINPANENVEMKDIAEVEEISEIIISKLDEKKIEQNFNLRNKIRNKSDVRLLSKEKVKIKDKITGLKSEKGM